MSVVEDTRKILQDFLAPELRKMNGSMASLGTRMDMLEIKLQMGRDENARNFEQLNAKLNLLLNLHSIEQRLARLEDQKSS
jgi:hypothetical protein